MTPKELYDYICSLMPGYEVPSICYVEKNCFKKGFCSSSQSNPVLDFDNIKNKHDRDIKETTPTASVDAITAGVNGKALCFVELKGWKNYIAHQTKQKKTIPETASSYNLAGKLRDSQNLCIDLCKDPDVFAHMPVRFVLVTDIDPISSGIEYIHSMLTALGETTTEVYSQCISESQKILESEIHIDKVFIQCKDFDGYLATI